MVVEGMGATRFRYWALWGAVALLATSCGLGDERIEEVDPDAIPATVTYTAHIRPRLDYYCVGCHHPDGPHGKAGGFDFSTYELVRATSSSIERVAFEEKIMPPGGARRMSALDGAIFRRWMRQGFVR